MVHLNISFLKSSLEPETVLSNIMQHTTAISPFILSKFSGKHSSKSCNPLRMLQNTLFSFPINMRKIIHMPLPHFLRHFFCYDPFPDMLPRRERRKPSLMYFIPIADFNPRSREGSDQWLPILFVHSKISIHAPARGATEVFRITPSMKLFQSTLPRGERHLHRCNRDCRDDFNPRSREGSDRGLNLNVPQQLLFQSTLPRGERRLFPGL